MGKRRNREEVEELVREFEASGETRAEFSERRGIAVTTLDAWRRKRVKAAGLVAVNVKGETGSGGDFRLSLRNGRRIESGWNFAEADLARLIRIAESA
jgi:hypothetical protein